MCGFFVCGMCWLIGWLIGWLFVDCGLVDGLCIGFLGHWLVGE